MKFTIVLIIVHEILQIIHLLLLLPIWVDFPFNAAERIIIIVCLIIAPLYLLAIQRFFIDKEREAAASVLTMILASVALIFAAVWFIREPFVKFRDIYDPHGDSTIAYRVQPVIAYIFDILLFLFIAAYRIAVKRKDALLTNILCYIPYGLWFVLVVISGLIENPGFIG